MTARGFKASDPARFPSRQVFLLPSLKFGLLFNLMSEDVVGGPKETVISLREVTKENLNAILTLKVKPEQQQFVASNAVSIAEAHYEEKAWFRAIYADETPVGFVMLYEDTVAGEYYLWRMMIGARYQGQGYGERAMRMLIEFVRNQPEATELLVSYVPVEGNPQPFYSHLGFVDTGEVSNGENVMRLPLDLPTIAHSLPIGEDRS